MEVKLLNIHKYFGSVKANIDISFQVNSGMIYGILGENGAGKSTLMKILAGFYKQTKGKILIDGHDVEFKNPSEAAKFGIGMLYQDPLDFPSLSILDNFMIGQTHGFIDQKKRLFQKFKKMSTSLDFDLPSGMPVNDLSIGQRQQLEILRLLSLGIKVLILDEPTTGISSIQKNILFTALKKLTSKGVSIILVSHKLEDVEKLCDCVTVLRRGRATATMASPFNTDLLLKKMFDSLPDLPSHPVKRIEKTALQFKNIFASGGRSGLKECNVRIRSGEVVGLAGLEGSGQGVFLRLAAGLRKPKRGYIYLGKKNIAGSNYHYIGQKGVVFMPTDRLGEGLMTGLTIAEHVALQRSSQKLRLNQKKIQAEAIRNIKSFQIKGEPASKVESLSGGNQQRLLLSFLPTNPRVLLLENPTRGLDVDSVSWVWKYLLKYCEKDASIIFSSSEIDEILMVADRVLIFFNGKIIKDTQRNETDSIDLGRAIAGKI